MPRFAANLSTMFGEWSFLDRFTAAADVGFEAVEYLFPYEFSPDVVATALSRSKLTQALFNMPPGNWSNGDRGLAALPERQEEFRASVKTALEYAKATGVKRVHMMAGLAPQDSRHEAAYRASAQFACENLGVHGLNILLEPINGRDMPGYFMNDFSKAAQMIDALSLPNLKLQFDIYHRQILHGDVMEGLKALLPMTDHVQIASVPMRHEPGTGELDDFRILNALDAFCYSGFVGCEYRPAGNTLEGLAWMNFNGWRVRRAPMSPSVPCLRPHSSTDDG